MYKLIKQDKQWSFEHYGISLGADKKLKTVPIFQREGGQREVLDFAMQYVSLQDIKQALNDLEETQYGVAQFGMNGGYIFTAPHIN